MRVIQNILTDELPELMKAQEMVNLVVTDGVTVKVLGGRPETTTVEITALTEQLFFALCVQYGKEIQQRLMGFVNETEKEE
jgi:hypothetical protein